MAADGHLGMMALSRVTLASAGLSCSYTNVSQGSVAMQLRCGWILHNDFIHCNFPRACSSERIFKLGHYFGEDMDKSLVVCFIDSRCMMDSLLNNDSAGCA